MSIMRLRNRLGEEGLGELKGAAGGKGLENEEEAKEKGPERRGSLLAGGMRECSSCLNKLSSAWRRLEDGSDLLTPCCEVLFDCSAASEATARRDTCSLSEGLGDSRRGFDPVGFLSTGVMLY